MKYTIEKDEHGYAKAIVCNDFYILHLVPGSMRNEKYAQQVVDKLNKLNTIEEESIWREKCLD